MLQLPKLKYPHAQSNPSSQETLAVQDEVDARAEHCTEVTSNTVHWSNKVYIVLQKRLPGMRRITTQNLTAGLVSRLNSLHSSNAIAMTCYLCSSWLLQSTHHCRCDSALYSKTAGLVCIHQDRTSRLLITNDGWDKCQHHCCQCTSRQMTSVMNCPIYIMAAELSNEVVVL